MPASTHNIDIKVNARDNASGVLDKIALHARQLQKENRLAGENALSSMLRNPVEFLNLGVKGIIADQVGRGFAASTDAIKKIASGEGNPADMMKSFAEGLPLLGEWVKGWGNVLSLIDGSADATAKLKEEMKSAALTSAAMGRLGASHDFFSSVKATPYEARLDAIEKQYRSVITANTAERGKLAPTDEEIEGRIGMVGSFVHNNRWLGSLYEMIHGPNARTQWHDSTAAEIEGERAPQSAILDKANEQAAKAHAEAIKRLQIEEAQRQDEAVRAINAKSLSMRLQMEEATAKSASQVWSVRLQQFSAEWGQFNADVAAKFNAPGTSDKEKMALFQMMQTHAATQPGMIQQAFNDQAQVAFNSRNATQRGLMGDAQQLLGGFQSLKGGDSWEAQKMQKYLSIMQFSSSMREQLSNVQNDKFATADQKAAALQLGGRLSSYTDLATSDANLGRQSLALRFASEQEVGSSYGGAADALREQYNAEQAKGDDKTQSEMLKTLQSIEKLLGANARKDKGNDYVPLLPS